MDDRWVVPLGPDFQEFDTLPGQAIADVEILADVGRRTSLGQELVQGVLDPLFLKVVEGHSQQRQVVRCRSVLFVSVQQPTASPDSSQVPVCCNPGCLNRAWSGK